MGADKKDEARSRRVDRAWSREGPPANLAEQLVAPTLRGRESQCSHGCGSNGACGTGGCGVGSVVDLVQIDFPYDDNRRIVEIRYKGYRRDYAHVEDEELELRVNDLVIVENDRGVDSAVVSMTGSLVHAKRKAKHLSNEPITKLLRRASEADRERTSRNRESESEAMSVCRSRIEHFGLPMHLVDAEWQFDHHRITFYFTADGRVDFRELVRDLAAIFRTRIELRQISVRDEAKRIGGMGICGRELCCTSHLGRYEHITLEHAKQQMLQVNPTKLSGQCGRLKCCLLYELDNYVDGLKRFPPVDSYITTSMGEGKVMKIDIFRDVLYLHHASSDQWETLSLEDLQTWLDSQGRAERRPSDERPDERRDRRGERRSERGHEGGDHRADHRGEHRGERNDRRAGSGERSEAGNGGRRGSPPRDNRGRSDRSDRGDQGRGDQGRADRNRRNGGERS